MIQGVMKLNRYQDTVCDILLFLLKIIDNFVKIVYNENKIITEKRGMGIA